MAWPQFVLAVLLVWLATALYVGTMVGRAFTLGSPDNT